MIIKTVGQLQEFLNQYPSSMEVQLPILNENCSEPGYQHLDTETDSTDVVLDILFLGDS